MKCVQCGAEIPYRRSACPECGLKISKMETVARRIEERKRRETNPFKWTLRDWLTIIAAVVVSGLILGIVGEELFLGMFVGLVFGSLFFGGFYCESLRYVIWRDLRAKALGEGCARESFARRVALWLASVDGAYQRMAGHVAVLSWAGAFFLLELRFVFEESPHTVFDLLALVLAGIGGIAVIGIGMSWERPAALFKRLYEWIAIVAIVVINVVTLTTPFDVFGLGVEFHPVVQTLILFFAGMLVAMFCHGVRIKRMVKAKGFRTPGLW